MLRPKVGSLGHVQDEDFQFSRAYEKIRFFYESAKIKNLFIGKKVLDVGSSTGGFTKFALEKGAELVLAVELGTKQMDRVLALDKRVKLNEKTDIFKVGRGLKLSNEVAEIDVVVMDVSFVSAREVLAHLKNNVLKEGAELVVLFKPQFEADERQLLNGIVKNSKMRREIIREFEDWLRRSGFLVLEKRDSAVAGSKGNVERLYLLKFRV